MENRKKIAFVVNVDWYFCLHWIERVSYFQSLGFEVHIIGNFTDDNNKKYLINRGFLCYDLAIKRNCFNVFYELSLILKLRALLNFIDPHLIHCITIKPNIYSGLLNRLFLKKNIVYSITGLGAVFSSPLFRFLIIKRAIINLYKFISTDHSYFIFENKEDCLLFQKLGVTKNTNCVVIRGAGIDLDKFRPTKPPLNRTILFAGRLLEDKGLRCLVEANRLLRELGYLYTLNVAGIIDNDVSSAISIEQIEEWARKGDINWLGNVKDMPSLISMNDLVCLPTTYGEGVPRILIEAASCQRPIVATDVAGCREIVSHGYNGYLVVPNDHVSLASYLRDLLEDYIKIGTYGQHGRKKVENEFSQEIVFEKTLNVYLELMGLS